MAESFQVDPDEYYQFDWKSKSPTINIGESVTVQMPILNGLFNCGKFLPMKYLQGLTIEFILVSKYKDAALKMGADAADEPSWTITEPVIKCQTVTIDNSLENEFTSRL